MNINDKNALPVYHQNIEKEDPSKKRHHEEIDSADSQASAQRSKISTGSPDFLGIRPLQKEIRMLNPTSENSPKDGIETVQVVIEKTEAQKVLSAVQKQEMDNENSFSSVSFLKNTKSGAPILENEALPLTSMENTVDNPLLITFTQEFSQRYPNHILTDELKQKLMDSLLKINDPHLQKFPSLLFPLLAQDKAELNQIILEGNSQTLERDLAVIKEWAEHFDLHEIKEWISTYKERTTVKVKVGEKEAEFYIPFLMKYNAYFKKQIKSHIHETKELPTYLNLTIGVRYADLTIKILKLEDSEFIFSSFPEACFIYSSSKHLMNEKLMKQCSRYLLKKLNEELFVKLEISEDDFHPLVCAVLNQNTADLYQIILDKGVNANAKEIEDTLEIIKTCADFLKIKTVTTWVETYQKANYVTLIIGDKKELFNIGCLPSFFTEIVNNIKCKTESVDIPVELIEKIFVRDPDLTIKVLRAGLLDFNFSSTEEVKRVYQLAAKFGNRSLMWLCENDLLKKLNEQLPLDKKLTKSQFSPDLMFVILGKNRQKVKDKLEAIISKNIENVENNLEVIRLGAKHFELQEIKNWLKEYVNQNHFTFSIGKRKEIVNVPLLIKYNPYFESLIEFNKKNNKLPHIDLKDKFLLEHADLVIEVLKFPGVPLVLSSIEEANTVYNIAHLFCNDQLREFCNAYISQALNANFLISKVLIDLAQGIEERELWVYQQILNHPLLPSLLRMQAEVVSEDLNFILSFLETQGDKVKECTLYFEMSQWDDYDDFFTEIIKLCPNLSHLTIKENIKQATYVQDIKSSALTRLKEHFLERLTQWMLKWTKLEEIKLSFFTNRKDSFPFKIEDIEHIIKANGDEKDIYKHLKWVIFDAMYQPRFHVKEQSSVENSVHKYDLLSRRSEKLQLQKDKRELNWIFNRNDLDSDSDED